MTEPKIDKWEEEAMFNHLNDPKEEESKELDDF